VAQRKRIVEGLEAFTSTPLDRLLAPSAPEPRALDLFHSVAESVPAYQAFLAEHGIDPAGVSSIDDFRSLPLLTKDNHLRRHELPALCRDGELAGWS
jgi:phenylacetate-CoA ligase